MHNITYFFVGTQKFIGPRYTSFFIARRLQKYIKKGSCTTEIATAPASAMEILMILSEVETQGEAAEEVQASKRALPLQGKVSQSKLRC
jgi:hypothetical protein